MLNTKMFRLSSLLLAIGLVLGLAITGCSDNDREGGGGKTVTAKNF